MEYLLLFLFIILLFSCIYYVINQKLELIKQKHFYFLFASFLFVVISIFPLFRDTIKNMSLYSSEIVFVLDVSSSMLALDYENNTTRLDESKKFIQEFIYKYPQNKYALTIFAWDVVDSLPLTSDLWLFFNILSTIDEKSILKWWTNIAWSITSAISRFYNSQNWWWIIVLSDFEIPNLKDEEKEKYLENIKKLKIEIDKKNINIINIWVWKKSWNKILERVDPFFWNMIYKKDKLWNDIVTIFDEDFFNILSNTLDALKLKINKSWDISNIISKINNIPANEINFEKTYKQDFSRYSMILSYLCFLIYLFLYFLSKKLWK